MAQYLAFSNSDPDDSRSVSPFIILSESNRMRLKVSGQQIRRSRFDVCDNAPRDPEIGELIKWSVEMSGSGSTSSQIASISSSGRVFIMCEVEIVKV